MKKHFFVLLLIVFGLFTFPVLAEDEGLYDPAAAEGSAFVRFINGVDDKSQAPAIRGKTYPNISFTTVSSYFPAQAGEADLKLGAAETKATLEKSVFYTAVLKGGTLTILKDESSANPLKAMLAFYNLTGKDALSLKTADGKVEVIPPVATGKSGYREINAVDVTLAVYDGDKKISDLALMPLKRRTAMTVVAVEKDDKIEAESSLAKTDTTK